MDEEKNCNRNYIAHLVSLLPCDTPEKGLAYECQEIKAINEGYDSILDKIETLVLMEYGQALLSDEIEIAFKNGSF